jgi:raffinose/stachyose/melibiose transport system substrate-binding protein
MKRVKRMKRGAFAGRLALFALLLSLVLTGCGGANNAAATTAAQTTPAETATAAQTTTAAPAETTTAAQTTTAAPAETTVAAAAPVTVTMLISGNISPNGNDIEVDIVPKYIKEAFPNITVETTKLPDDQYYTTVKTRLAAGQGPDIMMIFPKTGVAGAIDLAKAGYAKDISDMNFWDNIGEGAKNDMSYEGKPRAVAKGLDFLGVYYNKSLFEQAGVSGLPQSWQEFLDVCQKLKDAGITPITTADKDAWYIQFGLYQIAANVIYPDQMDFDELVQAGTKDFTDPSWIAALDKMKSLYDSGYVVDNSLGMGSAQCAQIFIDGQAAMTFDGTWSYDALTAQGAAEFERGFFALPANDAGDVYISASTAAGYGVNAATANYDAVKTIFEYWFDGQSPLFQAWVEANTSISVYKGVPLTNPLYNDVYNQYQSVGKSVYFCNQMWPGGVADEMEAKFQEVIGGQASSSDVAAAMSAKFEELWGQQ